MKSNNPYYNKSETFAPPVTYRYECKCGARLNIQTKIEICPGCGREVELVGVGY